MRAARLASNVIALAVLSGIAGVRGAVAQDDIFDQVEHHYVDNGDVRIHYVSVGEGPLVVFLHGFPDFWYGWRRQMDALKDDYRVVALDLRGYDLSGKPEGVEAYAMRYLTGDVATVIDDLGAERATIVGHDWGGYVAWEFSLAFPQMVDGLVVMNFPHPRALSRDLAVNVMQRRASAYAERFKQGSADDPEIFFGSPMTPETLSSWVTDETARGRYVEAFERSDLTAMLNYYKANWPDAPEPGTAVRLLQTPQVEAPTLVIHGLQDPYILSTGLTETWNWIDADLTMVTVPEAGHFVQQDAPDFVSSTLRWWMSAH